MIVVSDLSKNKYQHLSSIVLESQITNSYIALKLTNFVFYLLIAILFILIFRV